MYGNFVHATNDASHYTTPPTKWSSAFVCALAERRQNRSTAEEEAGPSGGEGRPRRRRPGCSGGCRDDDTGRGGGRVACRQRRDVVQRRRPRRAGLRQRRRLAVRARRPALRLGARRLLASRHRRMYHRTTTVLSPSPRFRDHLGEPVPEENVWTLWCKGRSIEADTPTIRPGATQSRPTSAHLHHPPHFLQAGCPFCRPTNSIKASKELLISTLQSPWRTRDCECSVSTLYKLLSSLSLAVDSLQKCSPGRHSAS